MRQTHGDLSECWSRIALNSDPTAPAETVAIRSVATAPR